MTSVADHEGDVVRDRFLVPTLVLVALMLSLISSLGAPLVPSIATSEGVSLTAAQWCLTVTLLMGAVATPVLGRLGDGRHRRAVLLGIVGAVFAGSLLAALPLGFAALLVGRGLQGLGMGLLPLVMAIARDHLDPERGRRTVGLLAVTGVAGVGLGYPVTGLLAEHGGVRGAFWFGVAVSGLALVSAALVVPASQRREHRPLDVLGALLVGAGFAALVVALADAASWGWGSWRVLGLLAAAAVALTSWTRHELRTPHPIVDLRLLASRPVLLADLTALLSGVALYLAISMCIRLVQTPTSTGYGIGASVAVGGLVLLPMSLGSVGVSRLVPALARRVPIDRLLVLGTVVIGAGLLSFAVGRSALWQVAVVLGLVGLGVGLVASVMPALILRAVPAHETGSATAFNQVLRNAGYAAGSAVSATVLEAHTRAGEVLPRDSGYQVGAYVGLGLCALTLLVVVPLLPRRVAAPSLVDAEVEVLLREEALAR